MPTRTSACSPSPVSPRRPRLPASALALLLGFGPSHATQVRPINLEEMSLHAARIFSGRCVDVRVEEDPAEGRKITLVTFAVSRAVKGEARGRVTIKMFGEQVEGPGGSRGFGGVPVFRKGEDVILFLYGESGSGFTSPVGFGQGKFVVAKDKHGRPMARNGFGNRNLLERFSPRVEGRIGRKAARWKGRGGLPPEDLLEMAEAIAK